MPAGQWAYAAAVLVVAFLIRGASGFGSGLVAIPLLAAVWPLQRVVPIIALVTAAASLGLGVKERSRIRWDQLARIAAGIALGVALGVPLLSLAHPTLLRRLLGVLVVAYALYRSLGWHLRAGSRVVVPLLAVCGGVIDTIFGIGGPLFVIALSLDDPDKAAFRATISGVLLTALVFRLAAYGATGLIGPSDLALAALALPCMGLGMVLGHRLQGAIRQRTFDALVTGLLVASGVYLMIG